jgi:hypothetical protein
MAVSRYSLLVVVIDTVPGLLVHVVCCMVYDWPRRGKMITIAADPRELINVVNRRRLTDIDHDL